MYGIHTYLAYLQVPLPRPTAQPTVLYQPSIVSALLMSSVAVSMHQIACLFSAKAQVHLSVCFFMYENVAFYLIGINMAIYILYSMGMVNEVGTAP